jgi:RHS repeat-associated protein
MIPAGNRYTDITHDWLGRISQITYPLEGGTRLAATYDYDAADLYDPTASYGVNVIDTNGIETQYLYNHLGMLWKVVKDRGEGKTNAVTTFEYDAYGNLISLTDPENHTTTFAYDSLDRLTSITDHLGRIKSFTYYPDGSLKTRTDQKGQTTSYTYNANNRIYQATYPDLTNITYTYEPNGLLWTATNTAGTVSFTYDNINRLESTNGALSGDVDSLNYQYYNGGQRQYMTSNLGQTSYGLNDWNALQSITNPNNRTITNDYNQYTGNLSRTTRPNSTYTDFDFDNLDRLDSYMTHTPTNNYNYDYTYYNSNLIQKIDLTYQGQGGPIYYEYIYDDLYRLANEYAVNGGVLAYANNYDYDYADNRIGKSNGALEGYTINALNQVTSIYVVGQDPFATFSFDLNGNTVGQTGTAGTTVLEYDYENRLKKITYPSSLGTTEFVYDSLGRRLKTIEKNGQGTITAEWHYVYDGLDAIALLNGSEAVVASITNGPGIDDPLIVRYNGADYFLYKNHQGSVTEVRNISGSAVKTYKYDAFGNILQETGPTIPGGFTYTGRELHARSGLYYYRARWYSPELGRFLTQDPIGYFGGVNLYAYVENDPVLWIDPFGLSRIVYDRSDGKIYVYPGTEETQGPPQAFDAGNRNAKHSNVDPWKPEGLGPAPNGTFPTETFKKTYGGPNSDFGYGFIPIILPPGPLGVRKGVGIHGGRVNRGGPTVGTNGCIRTTEKGMQVLEADPPTKITIQE